MQFLSDEGRGGATNPATLHPRETGHPLSYYVSIGEVARRVGKSPKTILKWARRNVDGCPPVFRAGDRSRIMDAAAVEQWIRARVEREAEADDVNEAPDTPDAPAR